MADEPETPAADAKPTPRRRGPNKTSDKGADKAAQPPKRRGRPPAAKTVAGKVEAAVSDAAAKPAEAVAAVTTAAKKAVKAVKPRSTNRARPTPKKGDSKKSRGSGTGRWAAIAGGVVAAGAATAALLTLRGSAAKKPAPKPTPAPKGAHQADGTNSAASFNAGIADEGTIPE